MNKKFFLPTFLFFKFKFYSNFYLFIFVLMDINYFIKLRKQHNIYTILHKYDIFVYVYKEQLIINFYLHCISLIKYIYLKIKLFVKFSWINIWTNYCITFML